MVLTQQILELDPALRFRIPVLDDNGSIDRELLLFPPPIGNGSGPGDHDCLSRYFEGAIVLAPIKRLSHEIVNRRAPGEDRPRTEDRTLANNSHFINAALTPAQHIVL